MSVCVGSRSSRTRLLQFGAEFDIPTQLFVDFSFDPWSLDFGEFRLHNLSTQSCPNSFPTTERGFVLNNG